MCYLYNSLMENLIQLERGTGEKPLKFLKDAYTILYSSITLLKTGTGLLECEKKSRSIVCGGLYPFFLVMRFYLLNC